MFRADFRGQTPAKIVTYPAKIPLLRRVFKHLMPKSSKITCRFYVCLFFSEAAFGPVEPSYSVENRTGKCIEAAGPISRYVF
jgi:hypothetical protein